MEVKMDWQNMTIKQYLEVKEKEISKNKYEKLVNVLKDISPDEKVLWAYFNGESKAVEDNGKPATIDIISTIDEDRAEEVLIPKGADLRLYAKTPTVLFGHNYNSIPVGVSKWQKVIDRGISSRTEYFSSDFARDVHEAAINGALANSVGFIPKKWVGRDDKDYEAVKKEFGIKGNPARIFTQWQLLEYSKVPVPCNPNAITLAMKSAKSDEMKKWLQTELETILAQKQEDKETEKPDTAEKPEPEKPAEQEKQITLDEVKEFCDNNGMVLSTKQLWDEIQKTLQLKAGAVLNKKNKENLKQAQSLIQGVIDSAEAEENNEGESNGDKTQKADEAEETKEAEKEKEKEQEGIEGLTFETEKKDEQPTVFGDEDVKKINDGIDEIFKKKMNKLLGKVDV